jgi:hypothetical protein
MTELENLNKQIRIGDVINVLMAQSTNLIDIVNKNQIEVNRLKTELDKLLKNTLISKWTVVLRVVAIQEIVEASLLMLILEMS